MVKPRWIVIDTKSGLQVGKFATRYGATVFAENLRAPPGRYAVVAHIEPSRVVIYEPRSTTGR
jgi:hypothetical protein